MTCERLADVEGPARSLRMDLKGESIDGSNWPISPPPPKKKKVSINTEN